MCVAVLVLLAADWQLGTLSLPICGEILSATRDMQQICPLNRWGTQGPSLWESPGQSLPFQRQLNPPFCYPCTFPGAAPGNKSLKMDGNPLLNGHMNVWCGWGD